MKITVHYDFTQQELVGEKDVFEIEEGTRLGVLLLKIDSGIMDAGKKRSVDTTYKTILSGSVLNGCVVFINGAAPEKMLEQELHDGDIIDFV